MPRSPRLRQPRVAVIDAVNGKFALLVAYGNSPTPRHWPVGPIVPPPRSSSYGPCTARNALMTARLRVRSPNARIQVFRMRQVREGDVHRQETWATGSSGTSPSRGSAATYLTLAGRRTSKVYILSRYPLNPDQLRAAAATRPFLSACTASPPIRRAHLHHRGPTRELLQNFVYRAGPVTKPEQACPGPAVRGRRARVLLLHVPFSAACRLPAIMGRGVCASLPIRSSHILRPARSE